MLIKFASELLAYLFESTSKQELPTVAGLAAAVACSAAADKIVEHVYAVEQVVTNDVPNFIRGDLADFLATPIPHYYYTPEVHMRRRFPDCF